MFLGNAMRFQLRNFLLEFRGTVQKQMVVNKKRKHKKWQRYRQKVPNRMRVKCPEHRRKIQYFKGKKTIGQNYSQPHFPKVRTAYSVPDAQKYPGCRVQQTNRYVRFYVVPVIESAIGQVSHVCDVHDAEDGSCDPTQSCPLLSGNLVRPTMQTDIKRINH